MSRSTTEILEKLGRHSKMVVAEDYELVRQQRVFRETVYKNGESADGGALVRDWLGLRLSHRGRPGFAATTDLSEEGLSHLVEEAFHLAGEAAGDPYFRFPLWKDLPPDPSDAAFKPYPSVFTPEFVGGVLKEKYESGTLETEIRRKQESRFRFHRASQHRAEIEWVAHEDPGSRFSLVRGRQRPMEGLGPLAFNLHLQSQWASHGGDGSEIARSSLVLAPSVVAELLKPLGEWFAADLVRRGQSPLAEVDGPLVSPVLSLRDVGHYPNAFFSSPFDLEGTPRGETSLVERGYVRNYLYDTYAATQENRRSTGNLWRGTDESWPRIQGSTLVVVPQGATAPELLQEMGAGIWVNQFRRLEWDGRRFQGELLGWQVEEGQPVKPLRGIRWQGDLFDVLRRAVSVGSDLILQQSSAVPSIYFENVPLK